jgi:hypothetical protein
MNNLYLFASRKETKVLNYYEYWREEGLVSLNSKSQFTSFAITLVVLIFVCYFVCGK